MNEKNEKVIEFDRRIRELNEKAQSHYDEYLNTKFQADKVLDEKIKYMKDNELLYPLSNFNQYKDKKIEQITMVDKEGSYVTYDFQEIKEIDVDGRLYISDFNNGIVEYNEATGKYEWWYCQIKQREYDFIGYCDLIFEEEDE